MQQLIANAVFSACIYALVGLGFLLIYKCERFFNFAHGAIVTLGAYMCLVFIAYVKVPLILAVACGVLVATAVGCLIEATVFRPLREVGATPLGFLLASLGVYIILQNVLALLFGNETQTLLPDVSLSGIPVLGARVTAVQLATLGVAAIALILVGAFLNYAKTGKMMRAVSSEPELARAVGIDVHFVMLSATAIGSTLAAIGGVLVALDVNMVPSMGMRILLMSIVAVVIGGIGRPLNVLGVVAGAAFVALLESLGVWKLPTQWQDVIIFGCLILFLLLRPYGFLVTKVRKT